MGVRLSAAMPLWVGEGPSEGKPRWGQDLKQPPGVRMPGVKVIGAHGVRGVGEGEDWEADGGSGWTTLPVGLAKAGGSCLRSTWDPGRTGFFLFITFSLSLFLLLSSFSPSLTLSFLQLY